MAVFLYDLSVRPHPHIRKTIKWGGAALTVLLLVVWIGSGWWYVMWSKGINGPCAQVSRGAISVVQRDESIAVTGPRPWPSGWECGTVAVSSWRPRRFTFSPDYWALGGSFGIVIPLWMCALALASITTLAFRLDHLARRRTRMNLCTNCHYDRTGLTANANCPECGQPPA